ncbi:hypothetical protein DNFV4_02420 [Nitrospira tepida]|uniref:DUF423 domain-containing protein n=1 Tax=Nitrospira tepida TaxID=2973512 RepID=A0AA86T5A0_9BACT|nr:DUF423 domain-containing protein [Nitrospira tepida]CAI4031996.1 hypothetical protein DNFV4_02420 [Nitrospira tepida]
MRRFALPLGSCLALLGVAAGAFGAHALKGILTSESLQVFEVGVRYQLYHAFGLLAVGLLGRQDWSGHLNRAAVLFAAGIVVFSGSLFMLALTGIRWLGALTPLGGICFLGGWASLAWDTWSRRGPARKGPS